MIWANVVEDIEAIIIRFLNGLNRKITNVAELQFYIKFKDMTNMDNKVDRELKRKSSIHKGGNSSYFHIQVLIIRERGSFYQNQIQ
jgi:hypothetical protein